MKRLNFLVIIFAIIATVACFAACGSGSEYEISLNSDKSFTIEVGDEVDFTEYFTVKDKNGNLIIVTEDMLDLSHADTSKLGSFTITITIGGSSLSADFNVIPKVGGGNSDTGDDTDAPSSSDDLYTVLAKYADYTKWNFAVNFTSIYEGEAYEEYYEYLGANILYMYTYDGYPYIDYLEYDEATDTFYYYYDNGDDTYGKISEDDEYFEYFSVYLAFIDLSQLENFEFTASGDKYVADNPNAVGNAVLYEYDDSSWITFEVYIANGEITKIYAEMDDGYVEQYELSDYGKINFTFPDASSGGSTTEPPTIPDELLAVLEKYADYTKWNFAVDFTSIYGGETYEEYYEYLGANVLNMYTYDGYTYTDYLKYDEAADAYYFFYDYGDGTYEKLTEDDYYFYESYAYLSLLDLTQLGNYSFTASGNKYVADNPNAVGNAVLYEYDDSSWITFEVYIANGEITKIYAEMDDGYVEQYVLSNHGKINFTFPDGTSVGSGSSSNPSTSTNKMEKQTYNPATFDKENLQDKMLRTDGAIGLPSMGNVNALVIPVQFKGDTITATQLSNLNIAFNGTSTQTGWESVKTYYQKASYGNLNLSFDIQPVYQAQYNSTYYANYSKITQDGYYTYGEEVILLEALAYYESRLDLTKYDTNKDGCIDAVYLIYSADVDYDSDDGLFWAFTTWYYGDEEYDGRYPYYYLFAGFDFMEESTANDNFSGYDKIDGLKINASTYIHETGHLLGLDDYYDYDEYSGCNEGLGGADMMDYTVGDQNVYSKMMLGWLEPTIVNQTTTITIESSQASGDAILIPLNFNNSYFCEYLLIDLYSAQGLNALHAAADYSYLYDGADYGVRIYHVSSSINNPYDNDYGSFTDYNNSITNIALIKLVEADGETKFKSTGGFAAESDLWQAGDEFSKVFPTYTRNDGKYLNFDIKINSVSATSANITVTFN